MNSRAVLLAALNHRTPKRVPVDFGSTAVTGMHCSIVEQLRRHFGLEQHPVKISDPYQMLGLIEEDLKGALGLDAEGVTPLSTLFGFPCGDWKAWRTPWGQEVLVPGGFNTTRDTDGSLLIYPCGALTAPPSGRMPANGYFFDAIVRQPPIDEDRLDAADNLEEFAPLSDADLARLAGYVRDAAATGRAVVAGGPGTALGDIALVPAPFLRHPKGIRDVAEWYISTLARPVLVAEIFDRQTEIALDNLRRINDACGSQIDVLFLCGTDFGTQKGSFCSPEVFRKLWLPRYRRMTDWIHANTGWKVFKHSCGAVAGFLDDFIEAGFDILNPVQCSAAGMDPRLLKQRYGGQIVFWGGGVDTQWTLPFGSPDEVRREVLERLAIFAPDGGFVFNAIHNLQANTPLPNVVAMFEAVRELNGAS